MMRCTSPFHGQTLERIAFRAGIDMPKMEFTEFNAPKSRVTHSAKEVKPPQISASITRHQHLGSTPGINISRAISTLSP